MASVVWHEFTSLLFCDAFFLCVCVCERETDVPDQDCDVDIQWKEQVTDPLT